jgi:hypothetical protein
VRPDASGSDCRVAGVNRIERPRLETRLAPETPAPGFLVSADVRLLLWVEVEPFFRKLSVNHGDHPRVIVAGPENRGCRAVGAGQR